MPKFSVEEINLICVYDTGAKKSLLADLHAGLKDVAVYEPEMREVFESTIAKLEPLSDAEFAQIGFFIADEYAQDEAESEIGG